jgi:UMF1 family MFS transporter
MGAVLALVLGGSQALSRSLFSQMIPSDQEAKYFGFYEISERGTSWIGPLVFALAVQLTGSQRVALISLIIFFVLGLVLLLRVNVRQAMVSAGNDPTGVVL